MIAHDVSNTIVLTDGTELLVHDGPTEGPRWRRDLGAPIVAVGLTAREVISLDDEGKVIWWAHDRDQELGRGSAGDRARAGVILPNGHVLVVTSEGAVLMSPSGRGRSFPWPDAVVAAVADDGRVLIADAAGKLGEFSAAGVLARSVPLDAPAVALAASAKGFWIVATAQKLLRLEGDQLGHITNAPADLPVRAVASARDGSSIAVVLGDALALVLSWPARDTIGQLRYFDRKILGVAYGPPPILCVSLEGGDGNKLDLQSGSLARTDTFPGRTHRRWMVQVSVDPPGAAAAPEGARPAATPPATEAAAAKGGGSSAMVAVILVIVAALIGVALVL